MPNKQVSLSREQLLSFSEEELFLLSRKRKPVKRIQNTNIVVPRRGSSDRERIDHRSTLEARIAINLKQREQAIISQCRSTLGR